MVNPLTSADEVYLIEVISECRVRLRSALATAESYRAQLPSLVAALEVAVAGCQQADEVLSALDDTE